MCGLLVVASFGIRGRTNFRNARAAPCAGVLRAAALQSDALKVATISAATLRPQGAFFYEPWPVIRKPTCISESCKVSYFACHEYPQFPNPIPI